MTIYLWFNAVAYAVFAIWCTLRPEQTSTFLGLRPEGAKGMSEFIAVYGGIEAGMAAFFAIAALKPALHGPAVLMAACVYVGLVAFRSIVLVRSGFAIGTASYAYTFELVMAVIAIALLLRAR